MSNSKIQDQEQNKNKNKSGKKHQKPRIPNKDGFSRISYLYQLSNALTLQNEPLSRIYSKSMDLTAKKSVLKLDPLVKRSICKKCDRVQIPGLTSNLALVNEGKKSETYVESCICGTHKRYPIGKNRDFILFTDKCQHEITY